MANGSLLTALRQKPQLVLPIRLALGLSQKEFLSKIENPISQVTLVKYEKGRSKRMQEEIAKSLVKKIPNSLQINRKTIYENFAKFERMKRGSLDSKRARALNRLWLNATSTSQRKKWGRLGAEKVNASARLNSWEKEIALLIEKSVPTGYTLQTHENIGTEIGKINIDFVLYAKAEPKYFIEVTSRRHDLDILAQAYAYRKVLLQKNFPKSFFIVIVSDAIPDFGYNVLRNEYAVFRFSEQDKIKKFLKSLPVVQLT